MILTGRDIRLYLETGRLAITPIFPDQFQQNGVDLILDRVSEAGRDPCDAVNFKPLTFYLGATRERLALPDDLMAFVELRSTWARMGLFIPPTIVDAGFRGNLTLEIFAAREVPVPRGQRFAHLIFAKTSGPAEPYRGKYLDQSGVTAPIPDHPVFGGRAAGGDGVGGTPPWRA